MLSPAILCLKKLIKMVVKRVPTRKVLVFFFLSCENKITRNRMHMDKSFS